MNLDVKIYDKIFAPKINFFYWSVFGSCKNFYSGIQEVSKTAKNYQNKTYVRLT